MTEVDGKATGWTATFDNDKWHQTLVKKKVTKAKPKTKAKTKTKTKTKAEAN
jgi:DNA topoisomerase-1